MSQREKLLKRFLEKPKDFIWDELVAVLSYYGFSEIATGKTSGSRRKFADPGKFIISLHKPHPSSIVKSYMLNQILEYLKEKGKLKND